MSTKMHQEQILDMNSSIFSSFPQKIKKKIRFEGNLSLDLLKASVNLAHSGGMSYQS